MTIFDMSEWGEVRLLDLFPVIERAKRRTVNSYSVGDVPYVTNSAFKNGISGYLEPKSPSDIEHGRCISINTVDGSAFWQESDFLANSSGNGLILLRNPSMTVHRALFLCAAISTSLDASFTMMLTRGVVEKLVIKVPLTASGDPDWEFMESTMRQHLERQEHQLEALTAISKNSEVAVDMGGWGEFLVGDFFTIRPTKAYKAINAELFVDGGTNPVVVNSALNNGIGGFTDREVTENGGIITFSDTTTSEAIFYQPLPFVGYPHVQGMYPHGVWISRWSEISLLFFMSAFRRAAVLRGFDYGDKFTRELATSLTVRLPVDISGEPDWVRMEQMMGEVLIERQRALDGLKALA